MSFEEQEAQLPQR